MMHRRLVAHALAFAVLAPVLASGLPACCAPVEESRSCCPAKTTAQAPKGCCKAPEAPRPEARSKSSAALVATGTAESAGPLAAITTSIQPWSVSFLRARLDGRAPSPSASPPDLPTLHRTLLI